MLPILEEQEDYSNDALYATLLAYVEKKGCKNGYVMWPIRTAVSGRQMTPCRSHGNHGNHRKGRVPRAHPYRNPDAAGQPEWMIS